MCVATVIHECCPNAQDSLSYDMGLFVEGHPQATVDVTATFDFKDPGVARRRRQY